MNRKEEVEELSGLSKEQLSKMFKDATFDPYAQLKGKDGVPTGKLIFFGTCGPIDGYDEDFLKRFRDET